MHSILIHPLEDIVLLKIGDELPLALSCEGDSGFHQIEQDSQSDNLLVQILGDQMNEELFLEIVKEETGFRVTHYSQSDDDDAVED